MADRKELGNMTKFIMAKTYRIESDRQKDLETILLTAGDLIEGPIPKDYQLAPNGKIELIPQPGDRPSVLILFNGEVIFCPFLKELNEALKETRTGIQLVLENQD